MHPFNGGVLVEAHVVDVAIKTVLGQEIGIGAVIRLANAVNAVLALDPVAVLVTQAHIDHVVTGDLGLCRMHGHPSAHPYLAYRDTQVTVLIPPILVLVPLLLGDLTIHADVRNAVRLELGDDPVDLVSEVCPDDHLAIGHGTGQQTHQHVGLHVVEMPTAGRAIGKHETLADL